MYHDNELCFTKTLSRICEGDEESEARQDSQDFERSSQSLDDKVSSESSLMDENQDDFYQNQDKSGVLNNKSRTAWNYSYFNFEEFLQANYNQAY